MDFVQIRRVRSGTLRKIRSSVFIGVLLVLYLFLIIVAVRGNPTRHHSLCNGGADSSNNPLFKVLVLYENGGHHLNFSKAAIPYLNLWATLYNFEIDYLQSVQELDSNYLSSYNVLLQLDYPPYSWPKKAMNALQSFITEGRIGWVGLHHATLLGEFDGFPMWKWFSWFMGGIRFKNYIAELAAADVDVRLPEHPVMNGVSSRFNVEREEWYTYDKVPGNYIQVLATVNESSYHPDSKIKMHSVHPVVWTNRSVKGRNLYIFMGHDPSLFENTDYKNLLRNAILWAAGIVSKSR